MYIFLEIQLFNQNLQLDVNNCLRITCIRNAVNISVSLDPGTYYLCNKNRKQNLYDAICTSANADPTNWFEGSNLQTYVADYTESDGFPLADKNCPLKPELSRLSSDQYCYKNSTCCLTKEISKLFGKTPCRMDYPCANASIYRSKRKKDIRWARIAMTGLIPILFLLGCLAVVGNLAVIFKSVSTLRLSLAATSKEIKAYNVFLLSLALADFLMGVYMVGTTSIGLKYIVSTSSTWTKATEDDDIEMSTWISNNACSFFGGVNFLSSQASVTALVSITGLRLYGVCYPYHAIQLKQIKIFVFVSWICWVVLCCLPVLNVEPIKTLFVDAIRFEENNTYTTLRYFHLQFVLQKLVKEINKFCGFASSKRYNMLSAGEERLYWDTLFTVAKKLRVLDATQLKNMEFLSYYSVERGCAPRFLVHYFNKFFYFSLSVLIFNTASFTFILFGQIAIAKKTFNVSTLSSHGSKSVCSCWSNFVKYISYNTKNPLEKQRETENQQMRRRMFLIVVTDFCCWIPISIISIFYNFSTTGQDICTFLPYRENSERWFYIFAMVMLPINSVINPFIYSYTTKQTLKTMFNCCNYRAKKKTPPSILTTSGSVCTVNSTVC